MLRVSVFLLCTYCPALFEVVQRSDQALLRRSYHCGHIQQLFSRHVACVFLKCVPRSLSYIGHRVYLQLELEIPIGTVGFDIVWEWT